MTCQIKKSVFHRKFDPFMEDLSLELYKEGFTVLSNADMRDVLLEQRQFFVRKYSILSVISPHLSSRMLDLVPFPGLILPCLLTVSEVGDECVEVVIVNPSEFIIRTINSPSLQNLIDEINRRLGLVIMFLTHKPAPR